MKKIERKSYNFFFVIVVLFWFAQYIYMPFFSPYLVMLGIPASIIGVIAGAYGFSQLLFRLPLSIFGSIRGNHKTIIAGGIVVVLISCALPLISHSWIFFLLTRALAGVASSTWVSYSAYLLEDAGALAKQRMGYLLAANTGGVFLSQVTGTIFFDHIGFDNLFIVAIFSAAASLVLLGFTSFNHGESEGVSASEVVCASGVVSASANASRSAFTKQSFIEILSNKNLWFSSVLMLIANWVAFSSNFTFTGIYAQEVLHADGVRLGMVALVFQGASILVSMLFGKFGDRNLPEKPLLASGFFVAVLCCVVMTLCGFAALIVVQVVFGIAISMINVILFARAGRNLSGDQQMLSMGLFQTIYSIGMTIGPIVSGFIFEQSNENFALTFFAIAAVALIGAVMAAFSNRHASRTGA